MLRIALCLVLFAPRAIAQTAEVPDAGSRPKAAAPDPETPSTTGTTSEAAPDPGAEAGRAVEPEAQAAPGAPTTAPTVIPAPAPVAEQAAPGSVQPSSTPAAGPASPVTSEAASASEPAVSELPAATDDPLFADEPMAVLGTAEMAVRQRALLAGQLEDARQRYAEVNTFLPTATLVLGLVATVTGVLIGAGSAFACDEGCDPSAIAGVMVTSGLAVSTAGLVWLYWIRDDQRVLRSEQYQLERDIRYIDWNSSAGMRLGVSGAF